MEKINVFFNGKNRRGLAALLNLEKHLHQRFPTFFVRGTLTYLVFRVFGKLERILLNSFEIRNFKLLRPILIVEIGQITIL